MTLKAPKVEAEAKTENVLDDDIPIRKEPTLAELRAERVGKFSDAEKSYVSMEDFANSESPIWRNVDYNDHDTKSTIMQDTHNTMVSEGSQIYNWEIKKDATLDGVGRGIHNRISNGVSSDASSETSLGDVQPVNFDSSHGTSSDVSDNSIPISSQNVNSKAKKYIGYDKKRIHSWLNVNRLQLPLHNLDLDSNTIIRNSAEKSTGKFSLSPIAPEIAPSGTLKITSDDVTLKAPKSKIISS